MSLSETAATGSRVDVLCELRDRLAADLDACRSARDVASLSQRLMDVLAQIDEVDVRTEKKGTALDEFTQRLAARQSATPAARRAGS